jgi:hypothetical protein
MENTHYINVHKVPIPNGSLIASALPRISYQDAYQTSLPKQEKVDPVVVLKTMMDSLPNYFLWALKLREKIAGKLGLKTADRKQVQYQIQMFEGKPGQSIALFHVFERSPSELLTGLNDKHLNFRFSIICETRLNTTEVILSTTVKFNNLLGTIYFFVAKPFHKRMMPVILRRVVARFTQNPHYLV